MSEHKVSGIGFPLVYKGKRHSPAINYGRYTVDTR